MTHLEIQDVERVSQIKKNINRYIFQSYGDNLHFFYQSDIHFYKVKLLMNAMDQKNLCMKQESKIYTQGSPNLLIQHKQNSTQCFCYPFYTNQLIVKSGNKHVGKINENCCRLCRPFNYCGKINSCATQSIQVKDQEYRTVFTIEGVYECALEVCQQFLQYKIYGETNADFYGIIKQQTQLCKCCPMPFSFIKSYSPLLRRTVKIEIDSTVFEQKNNRLQLLFAGVIFLIKTTKSVIC